MSVLRSKRQISRTEYENTMANLYKYSRNKTIAIPKRRQKWLCDSVDSLMNSAYSTVMEASTLYYRDEDKMSENLSNISREAIQQLSDLQKPLLVMWNVQRFEMKTMVEWATFINREMMLLSSFSDENGGVPQVYVLDWHRINSTEFLRNMSELHRYTHCKVSNAKMCYDNTEGKLLISFVDDALYHLFEANRKIPKTKSEYENRREHLSIAISSLNKMNRGILAFFNLMQYSERVMNEWSELLVSQIKLIHGLQKSDKRRFGSLA